MRTINIVAVAVCALFVEQILHEVCHGVAAVAFDGNWIRLHLFAMNNELPETAGTLAHAVRSGGAAVVNIVTGAVAAWFFYRRRRAARTLVDVGLLFFAAYSLFAGFGYLLFDAIFFRPGGENIGDWKKIIALFGGGVGARVTVGAVGLVGYIVAFFVFPRWVGRLATTKPELRSLTMWPFVVGNVIAMALSFGHPLGADGVIIVALKYWMGFCGLFWAYFMVAHKLPGDQPLDVGDRPVIPALAAAAIVLVGALVLALP